MNNIKMIQMTDTNIVEFKNKDLINVLAKEYEDILENMKKEDYIIEYSSFYQFHELIYDNHVVGFFTLDTFLPTQVALCLNECYILPEYRGNDILINVIKNYLENEDIRFYIRKPNKVLINFLIKYGLAFEVAPEIISSHIKFITFGSETYSNKKIKKLYRKLNSNSEKLLYYSAAFHMGLCSVFGVDPLSEIAKDNNTLMFNIPRKEDLKKYGLRKKLKNLSINKIRDIHYDYAINNDKIAKFNEKIFSEIDENNEDLLIIGQGDEVVIFENLKPNDAVRIDHAVNEEFIKGNLTYSSCEIRFDYLLHHPEKIDDSVDLKENDQFVSCPFCDEPVSDERYCKTCGQSLRNSSFKSNLKKLFNLKDK